jgi:hypothetical protein
MKSSFAQALEAKAMISGATQPGATAVTMIKDADHRQLLQGGQVVGVGVGHLDPAHEDKGAAVVIYTTKALSRQESDALAKGITVSLPGGQVTVPTRVERAGEFFANINSVVDDEPHTEAAPVATRRHQAARPAVEGTAAMPFLDGEYRHRVRPVPGGYSVGTSGESGTAGLIVINDPAHTQLYILSNDHVLNKDNSSGYTEDIQPGGADGGVSGRDTIGRLDRFVALSKTADNYLDAATLIPLSNALLDPRYGRSRMAVPGHYRQFSVGWRLFKSGRTTEDVVGVVDSVHTDTQVNYGGFGGLGVIRYKNQSIIKKVDSPVSLPGDSGSVWLKADDHYACAVNYAGPPDGSLSIAFPIEWFMTAFKCLVAFPNRFAEVRKPQAKEPAMLTAAADDDLRELLESLVQQAR